MNDEKIKTAAKKPQLALVPIQSLIGASRVFAYGSKKYAPGNYHNATLADGAGGRYIGGALRHMLEMQHPNGLHTAESLASRDDESGLPHIDHLICGLLMLRSIMTKCGALPADPGEGLDPPTQQSVLVAARVAKGEYDVETRPAFRGRENDDWAAGIVNPFETPSGAV